MFVFHALTLAGYHGCHLKERLLDLVFKCPQSDPTSIVK